MSILDGLPEGYECGFDEGMERVLAEIERLGQDQEHIVVAVTGSGIDVGKTTFSRNLMRTLIERGMQAAWIDNINYLGGSSRIVFSGPGRSFSGGELVLTLSPFPTEEEIARKVLILHAESLPYGYLTSRDGIDDWSLDIEGCKRAQNRVLAERMRALQLPIGQVDLRVLISRPGRFFDDDEKKFADVLIVNERAVNKYPGK